MKTFYSVLNEHANMFWWHLKKHHKKYIFWAVWWAILVKVIALILAWLGINYSIDHKIFANNQWEYCYLTGQYLDGGYEEWCYLTGQYLTEWTMTGCYMEWQYLTWGELDGSWNLIWQYLEWWYLTGCYMEWQELTWWYLEWCYMTWQYLTWWYTVCESQSWEVISDTDETNTCTNSDLNLLSPLSWTTIWWEISIDREYCAEPDKNITVQLFDHNAQWIDIATVSWTTTWIKFDSKLLSTWYTLSGINYGMYHIINQNPSWENYYTFTGSYTWNYISYFSEYKLRFIQDWTTIYTTDYNLTIDNQVPTVSLISFNVTPAYTWKVYLNSIAELIVESSEALSGVSFMVNNYAGGVTVSQSWTIYKIYQTLSSNNTSWTINYTIQYYDLVGNIWVYTQDSDLIFVNDTNTGTNLFTWTTNNTWTNTPATTTWISNTWINKTWTNFGFVLMNEISKFNNCKKWVSYKELKLDIHWSTYVLQMPEFKKSYVKKVINAFTLVVLSNIEKDKSLTKSELEAITNKFNNFLIILKLVRDNDNVCKQTLSNYHINEFKNIIEKHDLYSD